MGIVDRKNVLPTARRAGLFRGQATFLAKCGCGCEQLTVFYSDQHNTPCMLQSMLIGHVFADTYQIRDLVMKLGTTFQEIHDFEGNDGELIAKIGDWLFELLTDQPRMSDIPEDLYALCPLLLVHPTDFHPWLSRDQLRVVLGEERYSLADTKGWIDRLIADLGLIGQDWPWLEYYLRAEGIPSYYLN